MQQIAKREWLYVRRKLHIYGMQRFCSASSTFSYFFNCQYHFSGKHFNAAVTQAFQKRRHVFQKRCPVFTFLYAKLPQWTYEAELLICLITTFWSYLFYTISFSVDYCFDTWYFTHNILSYDSVYAGKKDKTRLSTTWEANFQVIIFASKQMVTIRWIHLSQQKGQLFNTLSTFHEKLS